MERSGCPNKGRNFVRRVLVQAQKFELSLYVGYHPYQKFVFPCLSPDHRRRIGKKSISNSFQTNFAFMENSDDGGESQPTVKNVLTSPTRKILFTSCADKSVIHSHIKQQFSSNQSLKSSFVTVFIAVVSFFQLQALRTQMSY